MNGTAPMRRISPAASPVVAFALLAWFAPPAGAVAPGGWSGRVSADAGYTTGVFPGYTIDTPDRFATLTASAARRVKWASGARLDWSGTVSAERFATWRGRNSERYETELRARRGAWRARVRGRYSPLVMLYPDALGGARYHEREATLGLDWRSARGLLAGVEYRAGRQDYDFEHAGRTQDRMRWGWTAGYEPAAGRVLSASFENEHAVADDSNYAFWANQVTLAGGTVVSGLGIRLETSFGLRNYFPASVFATNFRRQDRYQGYRLELRHAVGSFELALRNEWQTRDSTRPGRSFRNDVTSLALSWGPGR